MNKYIQNYWNTETQLTKTQSHELKNALHSVFVFINLKCAVREKYIDKEDNRKLDGSREVLISVH